MNIAAVLLCAVSFPQAASDPLPARARELPKLARPILVDAFDEPIVAVTGHAAPFVVDHDGDGLPDLVVGMFGSDIEDASGGTARVYRNVGTRAAPRFEGFTTLLAQGKPASMESS